MTTAAGSASDALGRAVDRFLLYGEIETLRLHRLKLQVEVDRISPLAVDLAAHGGFALDDIARRLPPLAFPSRGVGKSRPSRAVDARWRPVGTSAFKKGLHAPMAATWPHVGRTGAWMRSSDDPGGELVYAVSRGVLEAGARFGNCIVQTDHGIGRILLGGPLPDTLVAALPGRSLDVLLGHPVLSGRGYVIESVVPAAVGAAHVVEFRTGLLPHRMPFASILRVEMDRMALEVRQ